MSERLRSGHWAVSPQGFIKVLKIKSGCVKRCFRIATSASEVLD